MIINNLNLVFAGNHLQAPSPHNTHNPHFTAAGPAPNTSAHDPKKTEDYDLENLEMLYSAIDNIFDATMKSADSAVHPPTDPQTSAKPSREQQVENPVYIPTTRAGVAESACENPTYIPTTRASVAESALSTSQAPPKPLPRTKSQTEIAGMASGGQKRGSGEVKSQEGSGRRGDDRILAFEELSKNYAQLQLEVQKLKKEIHNNRELEGMLCTAL